MSTSTTRAYRPLMLRLALFVIAFVFGTLLAPIGFTLEGGLFALVTIWLVSRSIEWESHTSLRGYAR